MKKIAIAAIIAVASTVASAQTTVYGQMRLFVDSTKTGATTVTSVLNNASRIGFSVNENLGNGLTARAVIETSVVADDPKTGASTQLGDRQSTVGVSSKLLTVDIGRKEHGHYAALKNTDPFTNLYGSILGDVHTARGVRMGDAIFLNVTPVSNVSLIAERTAIGTGSEATVYGGSVKLFNIDAGAVRFSQGAEKSTTLTLGTKIANANIAYAYSDNEGVVTRKGQTVSVSMPVGPLNVKASYGKTNTDVVAYAIGADYFMSKRTSINVAYRDVNNSGPADVKQFGVGVVHRF